MVLVPSTASITTATRLRFGATTSLHSGQYQVNGAPIPMGTRKWRAFVLGSDRSDHQSPFFLVTTLSLSIRVLIPGHFAHFSHPLPLVDRPAPRRYRGPPATIGGAQARCSALAAATRTLPMPSSARSAAPASRLAARIAAPVTSPRRSSARSAADRLLASLLG